MRSAFTPVSGVIDHEHGAMAKAPETTTRASDTGAWYCGRASWRVIVRVSGEVVGGFEVAVYNDTWGVGLD